jgi:hypothetical protein
VNPKGIDIFDTKALRSRSGTESRKKKKSDDNIITLLISKEKLDFVKTNEDKPVKRNNHAADNPIRVKITSDLST